MSPKPVYTITDLLGPYPPPIRTTVDGLRRIILEFTPDATEKANRGWRSISYREARMGYFCGIFPFEDHVDLVFEFGALLPDPSKILLGEGRQVRYLRFQEADEIDEGTLKQFLLAALDLPLEYSARREMTLSRSS